MTLARGQSASDRAYEWTRDRILDGTFVTGGMISEGEISGLVGVSRTPVREAFVRLASEGVLELFPKRGAFVVPVTPAEMRDVIEARFLTEQWAVRVVSRSPSRAETVRALDECIVEMTATTVPHDPLRYYQADRRFHQTIVAAAQNVQVADFYRSLRDRQFRMGVAQGLVRRPTEQTHTEHQGIRTAIADGDAERAQALVAAHIRLNRDALEHQPRSTRPRESPTVSSSR